VTFLRLRFEVPLNCGILWDLRLVHPERMRLDTQQTLMQARPMGLFVRRGRVALIVGADIADRWGRAYQRLATRRGHAVRRFDSLATGLAWVRETERLAIGN